MDRLRRTPPGAWTPGTQARSPATSQTATTIIERTLARVRRTEAECGALLADRPVWGSVFSDHMVTGSYDPALGWHGFTAGPVDTFRLHPATVVLHYGQAVFEGLKGYRQPDGSVAAFRPDQNAKRFAASAERLAMPPLPEALFLDSMCTLAELDRAWVPRTHGASLYFRPMMFGTDVGLMTAPSQTYRFVLFACPVTDYFRNGVKPVTVWVSSDYVRAVRGGTGEAKCAGNYAASFLVQRQAAEHGCDQVVWLDAVGRRTIEEMGGMNIFFVAMEDGAPKLVTPEVSGSLLKGVTRDSLLRLAADLGYEVEERRTTVDDWRAGCADGRITEAFACGTAAVITPIGHVKSDDVAFQVGDGGTGEVTARLRGALLDIQHGIAADVHGWRYTLAGPA